MRRVFFCIAIMSLLVGCGRKTPVVPPNAVIPEPITSLEYQVDDTGATLSWRYPSHSIQGQSIKNIRAFQVHKAIIPEADYCDGCPVIYDSIVRIDARGTKPKGRLTYKDSDLQPGFHYVYMVRSDSGWRIQSDESNRVDFSYASTLNAPAELEVEVGDHVLTLTWQPVTHREDGSEVTELLYQVYRGTSRTDLTPHGDAVATPRFTDRGVSNERAYFYNVRAVTQEAGSQTAGHASATVSGMALDMVPPAPPQNVQLIALSQGVQLHWTPATDTDLGGYRVYRKKQGESKWQRIGSAAKGAIGFKDLTVLEPGIYSFVVTSFDIGLRHNESEHSVKVQYTAP